MRGKQARQRRNRNASMVATAAATNPNPYRLQKGAGFNADLGRQTMSRGGGAIAVGAVGTIPRGKGALAGNGQALGGV